MNLNAIDYFVVNLSEIHIALFDKNLFHKAQGLKLARMCIPKAILYIFSKFLGIIISKVFQRTCHSLTNLLNRLSQIRGEGGDH